MNIDIMRNLFLSNENKTRLIWKQFGKKKKKIDFFFSWQRSEKTSPQRSSADFIQRMILKVSQLFGNLRILTLIDEFGESIGARFNGNPAFENFVLFVQHQRFIVVMLGEEREERGEKSVEWVGCVCFSHFSVVVCFCFSFFVGDWLSFIKFVAT